jgi:hypothetical protein
VNRRELQTLARVRLAEGKILLSADLPDGAYYLAGDSVECALKACIAKGTQRYDFPEKRSVDASHTHNLKDLIRVAKLEAAHLEQTRNDSVFSNYWVWWSGGRSRVVTGGIRRIGRRLWWKRSVIENME